MKKGKVDYTNPDTQMLMIVGIPGLFFLLSASLLITISDYYAAELVSVQVADGAVHHNLVDGVYMIEGDEYYPTLTIEEGVGRFPFDEVDDGAYYVVSFKTLRPLSARSREGKRIQLRTATEPPAKITIGDDW